MRKLFTGLMAVAILSSLLTGCAGENQQTEVTVAAAKAGKDLSTMVWQGTVEALSSVDVVPNSNGKILEIPVKEGDHVNPGDVLFQVDDQDAKLQLEQAKAGYQAAEAAFKNAEKASQQNTSVRPAEIAFNTARDNFNRMEALYGGGAVSQAEYEGAKAQMDTASAQLQAARNGQAGNYDITKAQMESAKASLDIVQKKYDDCRVTAPISGMVTNVYVEVGQMVSPQVKAMTVIDDSGIKVKIQVADMDIDQLKTGMSMKVSLQSLGESCQGTVTEMSAVSNASTGMFTVTVQLEEAGKVSYIGLTADLRVSDNKENSSVYIPAKCIQSDDSGTFVYKVSNGTVVKTAITEGKKKNAYYEVSQGLSEGDEVVMQSSSPLEDGKKVQVLTVK
ncbi:efflux RND transporter periplasmic adaptor subunit [Lacrimispora brassicae]